LINSVIMPDTPQVVARPLGSPVVYARLPAIPDQAVRALLTWGTRCVSKCRRSTGLPLDRGLGAWHGSEDLLRTHVANRRDVVTLGKYLQPQFGPHVISTVAHF
jgi:hypothetical protein